LSALSAVLVALGCRSGVSPSAAATGALLTCFGTALWPMAAHGYDVLVEAVAVAAILWAGTGVSRTRDWVLAGLVMGAAVATRLGAVVAAVPAVVLVLVRKPQGMAPTACRTAAFAAGCAPGIAAVLWYNQFRFGSPFSMQQETGMGTIANLVVPWFSAQHLEAMAGLTVSPGKGLLWYSPPLIALPFLARPLWRRYREPCLALGAYLLVALIVYGRLSFWHGEWGWGPRYVAPFFIAAAPLAWTVWERWRSHHHARRIAVASFTAAMALQAIPVVAYPVEAHFATTLRSLATENRLVTTPVTRPPLPADNRVLYFEPANAMHVSILRAQARGLMARSVFAKQLLLAALAPLAAALVILITARKEGAPEAGCGPRHERRAWYS